MIESTAEAAFKLIHDDSLETLRFLEMRGFRIFSYCRGTITGVCKDLTLHELESQRQDINRHLDVLARDLKNLSDFRYLVWVADYYDQYSSREAYTRLFQCFALLKLSDAIAFGPTEQGREALEEALMGLTEMGFRSDSLEPKQIRKIWDKGFEQGRLNDRSKGGIHRSRKYELGYRLLADWVQNRPFKRGQKEQWLEDVHANIKSGYELAGDICPFKDIDSVGNAFNKKKYEPFM